MNNNIFEKRARNIMEYIDTNEPRLALEEYKQLVNESSESDSNHPVVMKGEKGGYLLENAYLIERLMAQSKSIIKLYIDDINESAYGNVILRNMLFNWLAEDEKRTVKMIVRKGYAFLTSGFYYTNFDFIKNGRIEVREVKGGGEFSSYAGIFDNIGIKIKYKKGDEEIMVGIFSDEEKAQHMVNLFDGVYDTSFPLRNKISWLFGQLALDGKMANSREKLIKSFAESISDRVKNSLESDGSIHLNKPIPLYRAIITNPLHYRA